MDYTLTNREKAMRPRLGMGYCDCDRSIIRRGQRCPRCRRVLKRWTMKKD